jgi:predicted RNA-binding Zn ribbon-like protein
MNGPHIPEHAHDLDLEAALDFLNTHHLHDGQVDDHFREPADAGGWFVEHGVLHPDQADGWVDADLTRVRSVREALREVVDSVVERRAPATDALELVNDALDARPGLAVESSPDGVRIGHRHAARGVDEALARIAEPIVDEIEAGHPERFRTCANDECQWTFFDSSPTGRRRWCDMRSCGNRAKAARHRERLRAMRAGEEKPARPHGAPGRS